MRHIHFLLAGSLVLAAMTIGCTSELENPEVDITAVRCSISQIDVEEDFATGALDTLSATRAVFSGANFLWSAGDKIGIVPTKGAQLYFSVEDGAGTSTASFDGGDWAMKSTGTFYAYYPLYPDIFLSKDHVAVSYTGQTQSGNNNNLHTGNYWTLYTEGTTAVGNMLNFTFYHLTSFFKTYVTVPAGTYTGIAFSAPSDIFIKEGYFDLGSQTPKIVGTNFTNVLTLDLQDVTFSEETELTGYLVVAPVDITGIPITVTVYKEGEAAYEYTLTKSSPMVAAKTYAFRATALTQIVSSVDQANALFASGVSSVTVSEPLTEDATIILPNTEEAVTLTLPTTPSSSTLTVSYDQDATACPVTLSLTGPDGANLDINAPNSVVTVSGVAYNQIISRTEANIISIDVTVNVLKVIQGDVQVYGTVTQIDLSEQEDEGIIYTFGTVTTLLGEDDEEYIPATGLLLNQSSMNLSVGESETLTVTVMPLGAYPEIIWSSSDETVATVSAGGLVTAVARGSATITATTISGGFTASCIVSVDTGSSSETNMINYYACAVFGGHSDIYLFGDTIISDTYYLGYGTQTLLANWSSAVAYIGDNEYNLNATDGFLRRTSSSSTPEEIQFGTYTWCWAFQNSTVQNALKVASTDSPVTIIMTDVNGKNYTLVYTKPQTSTVISTYYEYEGGTPSVSVPEAVDLGLSVKWASFNLGASTPEDYGDYFAWGETSPKSNYDLSTYFDNPSGDGHTFTKYAIDKKTELDLEDDAARQNWGGSWRMPTDAEWTELRENCTWTWKTTGEGYAKNGYLVTATNGNTIFLPAAGGQNGTSPGEIGSNGYYYSSSLCTSYADSWCAWFVDFNSSGVNRENTHRYIGLSVRPVYGDSTVIPVSGVILNKTSLSMTKGESETLTATVIPSNASNQTVTWSSSDSSVATVDSEGTVMGVSSGTAVITVTTEDGGLTANCSVTVKSFPEGNVFDEDAFISYVANHQEWFNMSTDKSYMYDTYFSTNASGTRIEMKFQLPDDYSKDIVLSDGSGGGLSIGASNISYYSWERHHEDGDTWYEKEYVNSSDPIDRTGVVVLTASCDGNQISVNVNGQETTIPVSLSSLVFQYLFSEYDSESGDGALYIYRAGIPDGTKLYYVKIWNGDNLVYFGHASRATCSYSSEEEYCWYDGVGGTNTFARNLHTLTSSEIKPYNPTSPIVTVRQAFGGGMD